MEHFPALSSMIFLLYSRHCEILNEHDKVSILGNVTYDVDADQISYDGIFSMFQGSKQAMINLLNKEWWS